MNVSVLISEVIRDMDNEVFAMVMRAPMVDIYLIAEFDTAIRDIRRHVELSVQNDIWRR